MDEIARTGLVVGGTLTATAVLLSNFGVVGVLGAGLSITVASGLWAVAGGGSEGPIECPACGATNPGELAVCGECGESL